MTPVHVFSDRIIVRAGVEAILMTRPNISVVGHHRVADMPCLAQHEQGAVAVVDDLSLKQTPDRTERDLRILTRTCQVLIIVSQSQLERYLRAGARALIADNSLASDLVAAVTALSRGEVYLSAQLLGVLVDSLAATDYQLALLTEPERIVLDHLLAGLSNGDIGRVLHVSDSTVKFHISNIFRKFGGSTLDSGTHRDIGPNCHQNSNRCETAARHIGLGAAGSAGLER